MFRKIFQSSLVIPKSQLIQTPLYSVSILKHVKEPEQFKRKTTKKKRIEELRKETSKLNQSIEENQQRDQKVIRDQYIDNYTPDELEDCNYLVKKVLSLENATPRKILQFKIKQAKEKFQLHQEDCGSSGVQIAVLSEKIIAQINHLNDHRQDTYAAKRLQYFINQRRKVINYMRRTDFHRYKTVIAEYNIPDKVPKYAHHKENFRLYAKTEGRAV